MTALEYMEKQIQKHQRSYERELLRGATEEMLYNIALKITYYKEAAEELLDCEVVRCKDCEFCYYNSSNDTFKCKSMRGMYRTVMPVEFCSWGERKDNG